MGNIKAQGAAGQRTVAGRAIAPCYGVGPTVRRLVVRIGKVDGLVEGGTFIDRQVDAGIYGDHLGWWGHGNVLATRVGKGAILVLQRNRNGLCANRRIRVRHLAISREVRGKNDLNWRAVTPVDLVFADRIGARIIHPAEVQGIDIVLEHVAVAEQGNRRRHVGHDDLEAVGLYAVGLAALVVGGHAHRIGAVVEVVVRDAVVRRVADVVHLHSRSIAPVHRNLVTFGIRIAQFDIVAEPVALIRRVIGACLQPRRVIDVGEIDVGEYRRRSKRDTVRPRPAELIEAEEVGIALIGQLAGLQISQRDFLIGQHGHTVQTQRAFAWQGDDFDRLQALAIRVVEAGFEQSIGKDDDRLFLAADADIGHRRCGVAEALELDFVGVVATVSDAVAIAIVRSDITSPSHHEATISHRGDRWLLLRAIGVGIYARFAVDRRTRRIVLLHVNIAGVIAIPGGHPAAVLEGSDINVVLRARYRGIDTELGTDLSTSSIVTLGINAPTVQILTGRLPSNKESTILQSCNRRLLLSAVGVGINLERRILRHAAGVEALAKQTETIAIGAAGVSPKHDKTAVGQYRNCRLRLVQECRRSGRIGLGLDTLRDATRVEALEEDVSVLGVAAAVIVVIPRDNEAAISRCCQRRLMLAGNSLGIDSELATGGTAVGVVALGIDTPTAAILAAGRPGYDKAATRQTNHLRFALGAVDIGIDLELATDSVVVGIVELAVDTNTAGISTTMVFPNHHVPAVG